MPMRNVSKVWQRRLLAAVTLLALVMANAIGAYAHAAGHAHQAQHAEAPAWTADHCGHHRHIAAAEAPAEPADKGDASGPGHNHARDHGQEGDGTGQVHLDCCDTICHGGQAILAPVAFDLPSSCGMPMMGAVAAFLGAVPGGLDRPPKAPRPA
jgi:hypothetical protein